MGKNEALLTWLRRQPSKDGRRSRWDDYSEFRKGLLEGGKRIQEANQEAMLAFIEEFNDAHVAMNRKKQTLQVDETVEGQRFDLVSDVLWVYQNRNVKNPSGAPSTGALGLMQHALKNPEMFYNSFIAPLAKSELLSGLANTVSDDGHKQIELLDRLDSLLSDGDGRG